MFDGIDIVVLPVADTGPLRELYVDLMGFEVVEDGPVRDADVRARLWDLPLPPAESVLLGKPGSRGGWIRLVGVPGLPAPDPAGVPDRPGAYALDFYLRDPAAAEEALEGRGWTFVAGPVDYLLPGTDHPVRERMLDQTRSGLRHAFVQYREGRTRCVLGERPEEDVSEVNAVVFATGDLPGARAFVTDVLGGRVYFSGRFDGPAVERLLGLPAGAGFDAAIARGPASRNARLEFIEHIAPAAPRPPHSYPRVVAGCAVDDLDALAARLAGGGHGRSTGIVETADGPRLGLRSTYGAGFEFWRR
ncbi:VOC family protein [Actinomadura monticuli]|uniref:VOC domain-containing protein n=1 Tax=Actinomadura monticuli TaxID=3097367 RepID=A0ABV4QGR5_9ACTN